jgi:hypothetical protein
MQGLDAIIIKHISLLDLASALSPWTGRRHARRSKRLDCAFSTQELTETIVSIDITPCHFIVAFDHRGLFLCWITLNSTLKWDVCLRHIRERDIPVELVI